ncbi:MAG: hypothetical protein WAK60_06350 [Sedimentisphaerales bacterium]
MVEKIKYKIKTYFERNLTVFPYAVEKCRVFLLAQTPEEILPALWHISQLVHILPDELVLGIINIGWRSRDTKILEEIRYLVRRWGKTEGKKLLSLLENNSEPEIMVPEGEEAVEKYLSDILQRAQEKEYIRISRYVMGFGVGGGLLLILGAACLIVGVICRLPYESTLVMSYISAAFGIEGILVTLFFLFKREVIIKRWQLR